MYVSKSSKGNKIHLCETNPHSSFSEVRERGIQAKMESTGEDGVREFSNYGQSLSGDLA